MPETGNALPNPDELSLEPKLISQLETFVETLRTWYGTGADGGSLRFLHSQSAHCQRLDCWYQNTLPAWYDRTVPETTRLDESELEEFDEDASVEVVSEASGNVITLTAMLSGATRKPKWGCWWNSLETVSGDLWGYWSFEEAEVFLISDGLGHGEKAAESSRKAADVIEENGDQPVDFCLKKMHRKLQSTRGAVAFLGRIPVGSDTLQFCSIGDIFAKVIDESSGKGLVSFNGTLGYGDPHINVRTLSLKNVSHLVLQTDGVEPASGSFYDPTFRDSSPVMNAARLLSTSASDNDDALVGIVTP